MTLARALTLGTALLLTAPAFAADSSTDSGTNSGTDWHNGSYQPGQYTGDWDGGGCSWGCEPGEATIVNYQHNTGPIWSKINADVSNAEGDVTLNASAVGNTAEVVTLSDSEVSSTQVNNGDTGAVINGNVDSVNGYVTMNATSVCNNLDVSTDPNVTVVDSEQTCTAADPSATVNAQVSNTGGVGLSAVAVGNQFTTDSNATHFPVTNNQNNSGAIIATVNAGVHNVGAVDMSATAVGNTAQIVHYNTSGL